MSSGSVKQTNQVEDTTRLTGARLRAARGAWIALFAVSIITFVLALPIRHAELTRLAPQASRPIQQLSPAEFQLLERFGVSLSTYASVMLGIEIAVQVVFTALGVLIFAREPRNWVALIISIGLVTYGMYATPALDAVPLTSSALGVLSRFVQTIGLQIALTFFFIFPDGRFVPRGTSALAILWAAWIWSAFLLPGVPWNFLDPWTIQPAWFVVLMAWWSTGLIAQFIRLYQEPSAERRQQTKWVVYSVTLAVVGYAVAFIPRLLVPDLRASGAPGLIYTLTALPLFFLSLMMFPFAMTSSILRYRLWDIDRLIGRTVIYGIVSGALALIYVGTILLLQQLLQSLVLQRVIPINLRQVAVLTIVFTTIALAWLATPLRRRVQTTVDRRFFRAKYDADQTVEAFSRTARDTVDLNILTTRLSEVVDATLQPSHLSVWIKESDEPAALTSPDNRR